MNKLNGSQFNMNQLELKVLNQIECKINKFGYVEYTLVMLYGYYCLYINSLSVDEVKLKEV